jgi:hypothetical protein
MTKMHLSGVDAMIGGHLTGRWGLTAELMIVTNP